MHNNDRPVTDAGIPEAAVSPAAETPNTITPDPGAEPPAAQPSTKEVAVDQTKEPETPEWFMKDKFKTIDDQAKSYHELSSMMGKYWGSPQENYSIEGIQGVEANDPLIASLSPVLKEMGISQDGFKHLVGQYMSSQSKMMGDMEAELKKTLTETDAHTYNSIEKWMTESMTKEEQAHVKNNWLMTAADFKLFNSLRLMAAPSTNVPNNPGAGAHFESSKEVENDKITYRKEIKSGARVQDKNYENQLASRYRDAIAREIREKGR